MRSEVYLNYSVYGDGDAPIDMDYFVWVVRNAHRVILVDTGYSIEGGASRGRTPLMTPVDAWRHLGIDLDSELTVVLSHAHYDHAGNLAALPKARIVVSESEVDFWLGPLARRAQFHHSADADGLTELAKARKQGRVKTFSGAVTVAPGVEVLEVGGHTPGQAIVRVETAAGRVLLASDSVHYYEELEADMPFTHVADLPRMYRTFDLISGLVATGQITHLVAGHDPSTLERFPAYDGVPGGLAAIIGRISQ
ncbi:MAG: N-acyl homoserine lactonase family protein [Micrococcales bacterium]|nr:N-acyl homoserine lactonase family protein [Micrococcales bacterium]